MKKRVFAVFLLAVIVSVIAAGCSKGKETTNPAKENTTAKEKGKEKEEGVINLSIWAEAANNDLLNKMIDSFKEKYKGEAEFEITLVESADSATRDKLLGDIHNGADVFAFADDQLSAMAAGGALEPVSNAEEVKAANLEEAVAAASINDILYAYPMTADNGYFLYYNKKYFSDKDVQTLDGILAAAKKAKKKFSMEWDSGWYLYAFFGNTGLEFGINDDGVTNYCTWNSKKGSIKGVDIAEALLDISSSPAFISTPDGDVVKGVQKGNIIAAVSGVWNEVEIKKAWGQDYGAVKLPTYTVAGKQVQMSSFTGYKMMGVNYYSEHKEWAMKLADWLTNEQNQLLRLQERSQGPSNIVAAQSEAMNQVPALQAVIDQAQYGNLQRVGNNFWTPCSTFGNIMAAGNPDKISLQKLMDNLVEGITASTVQ